MGWHWRLHSDFLLRSFFFGIFCYFFWDLCPILTAALPPLSMFFVVVCFFCFGVFSSVSEWKDSEFPLEFFPLPRSFFCRLIVVGGADRRCRAGSPRVWPQIVRCLGWWVYLRAGFGGSFLRGGWFAVVSPREVLVFFWVCRREMIFGIK